MATPDRSAQVRRLVESIVKAVSHKYLRKWRGSDGKWRYKYPSKRGGKRRARHEDHGATESQFLGDKKLYHVGAAFAAGRGKGHHVILDRRGHWLTVQLDDDGTGKPGKARKIPINTFQDFLRGEHSETFAQAAREGEARRLAVLESAEKIGSKPHIKRAKKELRRWRRENRAYLQEESKVETPPPEPTADTAPKPDPKFMRLRADLNRMAASDSERQPDVESVPAKAVLDAIPKDEWLSIPDLQKKLEQGGKKVTPGMLKDASLALMDTLQVYQGPWTEPIYEAPEPHHVIVQPRGEFIYYLQQRPGTEAPELPEVQHYSEQPGFLDEVRTFLPEAGGSKWMSIPDLAKKLEGSGYKTTPGMLHDALLDLSENLEVTQGPWTLPIYEVPEPNYALVQPRGKLIYYLQKR